MLMLVSLVGKPSMQLLTVKNQGTLGLTSSELFWVALLVIQPLSGKLQYSTSLPLNKLCQSPIPSSHF